MTCPAWLLPCRAGGGACYQAPQVLLVRKPGELSVSLALTGPCMQEELSPKGSLHSKVWVGILALPLGHCVSFSPC